MHGFEGSACARSLGLPLSKTPLWVARWLVGRGFVVLLMRYLGIVWGPGYPHEHDSGPFFPPIFQRGVRASLPFPAQLPGVPSHLNGVRRLHLQGDDLAVQLMDEDLHITALSNDQAQSRPLLNRVVRQREECSYVSSRLGRGSRKELSSRQQISDRSDLAAQTVPR